MDAKSGSFASDSGEHSKNVPRAVQPDTYTSSIHPCPYMDELDNIKNLSDILSLVSKIEVHEEGLNMKISSDVINCYGGVNTNKSNLSLETTTVTDNEVVSENLKDAGPTMDVFGNGVSERIQGTPLVDVGTTIDMATKVNASSEIGHVESSKSLLSEGDTSFCSLSQLLASVVKDTSEFGKSGPWNQEGEGSRLAARDFRIGDWYFNTPISSDTNNSRGNVAINKLNHMETRLVPNYGDISDLSNTVRTTDVNGSRVNVGMPVTPLVDIAGTKELAYKVSTFSESGQDKSANSGPWVQEVIDSRFVTGGWSSMMRKVPGAFFQGHAQDVQIGSPEHRKNFGLPLSHKKPCLSGADCAIASSVMPVVPMIEDASSLGNPSSQIRGVEDCGMVVCGLNSSPSKVLKNGIVENMENPRSSHNDPNFHLPEGDSSVALAIGDKDPEVKGDNVLVGKLIGKLISKIFSGKRYFGKVVHYDNETGWFKVVYEDGDKEDLEIEELIPLLVLPGVNPAYRSALRERSKRIKPQKGNAAIQTSAKSSQSSLSKESRKRGRKPRSKTSPSASNVCKEIQETPIINPVDHSSVDSLSGERETDKMVENKAADASIKKIQETPIINPVDHSTIDSLSGERETDQMVKDKVADASTKKLDSSSVRASRKRGRARCVTSTDCGTFQPMGKRLGEIGPPRSFKAIGKNVEKEFQGVPSRGKIVGFHRMYTVVYEDGNTEHLLWRELQPFLSAPETAVDLTSQDKAH